MNNSPVIRADNAALLAIRIILHEKLIDNLSQCNGKTDSFTLITLEKQILETETEIKLLANNLLNNQVISAAYLLVDTDDRISGITSCYQDKLFGIYKLASTASFAVFCSTILENNITINI
jgi:hypothetical protein